MKNWIVTYYDSENNILHTEIFENRLEKEAEKEAISLMPFLCYDWTLTLLNN